MNTGVLAVAVIFTGVLSALITPVFAGWARRRQLLDVPNHRSSHVIATPRTGGWSLVGAALAGFAVAGYAGMPVASVGPILVGATAIAAVGLVDDLRPLPAISRLLIQLVVATSVVLWVGRTSLDPAVPRWAGVTITVFWIVAFTNAFNFMDGIDGIAGAQAVLAATGWLLLGANLSRPEIMIAAVIPAAAAAGFLLHNWPPARVFMGDAGSGFLGFLFATLHLLAADAGPVALGWGVLLMWPFVFDTAFTLVRRLRRREDVLRAHRSHLYQRLVATGFSHRRVTSIYAVFAVLGVVTAMAAADRGGAAAVVGLLTMALSACWLWWLVAGRETRQSA